MEKTIKITIDAEGDGQRADKLLADKFPARSRAEWQRGLRGGLVWRMGKVLKVAERLKAGDELEVPEEFFEQAEEKTALAKKMDLKIVFEDDNCLVVEKLAGVLTHPTGRRPKGVDVGGRDGGTSLIEGILARWPEVAEVGENPLRPGIVHRLDKDVSGLLVVAKSQAAFRDLKKQFQRRAVLKIYEALVYGSVTEQQGVIDEAIGRSGQGTKMTVGAGKDTKPAVTEYQVLGRYIDKTDGQKFTLLEVKIKTGRTHQIRAHLNFLGHSVVGDKIYRTKRVKTAKLDRLFLHARRLGFSDLKGVWREFEAEWPEDLKGFFVKLRKI